MSLAALLGVALALAYLLYTAWIVVTPLLPAGHPVQAWVPERYWGLAVPVTAGVTLLSIATGVYVRIMRETQPEHKKQD